jgi:EmrB/QacA subfamily drug resistance transporter
MAACDGHTRRETAAPPGAGRPGHPWWILGVVQLGHLMSSMDGAMVAIALPSMASRTGIPIDTLQWVVTAYYLTCAIAMLVAGRLGDRLGRGRLFTFGFVLFTAASAGSALAPDLPLLIASRVLQAVGAASLLANGNAIITSTFADGRRGFALGFNSTILAGGAAFGYVAGGWLVDSLGWQAVFLVNLPVGLVATALALAVLDRRPPSAATAGRFDVAGATLLALATAGLLVGLDRLGHRQALTADVLALFAGSLAALAALVAVERRTTATPLLPLAVFGRRNVAVGLVSIALFCSLLAANGILMPLYLQGVLGISASEAGLVLAPVSLALCVMAPLSGLLADRFNAVWLMVGGAILAMGVAMGFACLGTAGPLVAVAGGQLVIGLAAGLFFSPNRVVLFSGLADHYLGVVSGLMQLTRQITYAAATSVATLSLAISVAGHGDLSRLKAAGPADAAFNAAVVGGMSSVYRVLAMVLAVTAVLCVWHALSRRPHRAAMPAE